MTSSLAIHTFIYESRLGNSSSPHALSTICKIEINYNVADLTSPYQKKFITMILTDMSWVILRSEYERYGQSVGNDICVLLSV